MRFPVFGKETRFKRPASTLPVHAFAPAETQKKHCAGNLPARRVSSFKAFLNPAFSIDPPNESMVSSNRRPALRARSPIFFAQKLPHAQHFVPKPGIVLRSSCTQQQGCAGRTSSQCRQSIRFLLHPHKRTRFLPVSLSRSSL